MKKRNEQCETHNDGDMDVGADVDADIDGDIAAFYQLCTFMEFGVELPSHIPR